MKFLKNTLIVSSYLLLMALFFGVGFAVGKSYTPSEVQVATENIPVTEEAGPVQKTENIEYEVIISDGLLILYKCTENEKEVISSESISESVFPKADIE